MRTRFVFVIAVCLALRCSMLVAQDQPEVLRSNHMSICEAQSDFVGEVEVVSMDGVRKPAEKDAIDLNLYGHLVTLRIQKAYFWRKEVSNPPDTIYIYREGAVGGSFHDPVLKKGDKGVVFLKQKDVPNVVRLGLQTAPRLPNENYYMFAVLPERNMPLKKACISASDSNAVAVVSEYFMKRAKQRLERMQIQDPMNAVTNTMWK